MENRGRNTETYLDAQDICGRAGICHTPGCFFDWEITPLIITDFFLIITVENNRTYAFLFPRWPESFKFQYFTAGTVYQEGKV